MPISIDARFSFTLPDETDALLQIEAARIPEQRILSETLEMSASKHRASVPAQDRIGERIWIRASGDFEVRYSAEVEPQRSLPDLGALGQVAPHDMPGDVVQYLFDSRYCASDRFQAFANDEFAGTLGGERMEAILDWLGRKLAYTPGVSGPQTSALDTFVERRGICRDYTHVIIALARASTIPARYVACYAPGVDPPDFHAVAEVFLDDPQVENGGTWQMVDGTQMADPAKTVKIGIGRDAADVSFLTSFGPTQFRDKLITVKET